jgi:hypothetical protein
MTNATDFLMGGGVKSAKFEKIGDRVTGYIVQEPEVRQQWDIQTKEPLTWRDGSPRNELRVIVALTPEEQTDDPEDDQVRAVYIKGQLVRAVRDAVKKAGAKELAVNGKLRITYVANGQPPQQGFNPPKVYEALYRPPTPQEVPAPDQAQPASDLAAQAERAHEQAVEVNPDDIPF